MGRRFPVYFVSGRTELRKCGDENVSARAVTAGAARAGGRATYSSPRCLRLRSFFLRIHSFDLTAGRSFRLPVAGREKGARGGQLEPMGLPCSSPPLPPVPVLVSPRTLLSLVLNLAALDIFRACAALRRLFARLALRHMPCHAGKEAEENSAQGRKEGVKAGGQSGTASRGSETEKKAVHPVVSLFRSGTVGVVNDKAARESGAQRILRHQLHLLGAVWVELKDGAAAVRLWRTQGV